MSEREEYTPTTDEVRETYERARYYLDDTPEEGDSYRAGGGEFDRWITAHDRALREQVSRDIEQHYLGPDSGRCFDGRDAPNAAEMEAFDEGLQFAASIARGEEQTDE